MADQSPDELQAEIKRLKQANEDLSRTNRDLRKGPAPEAQHALAVEAATLKAELARLRGEVAAEHGPARDTKVCYQGPGEPYCRPAKILSDGFSARVPQPGGQFALHCHLEYGEPPHYFVKDEDGNPFTPGHTFEVDRAWNPLGAPGTWHLLDECPHKGGPGCPYGAGNPAAKERLVADERIPQAP